MRHPVPPFFRVSDHHRPDNERRTPAENMAIIKIYGGTQFPRTALDPTPTRILKNTGCAIIHYSYVCKFYFFIIKAKISETTTKIWSYLPISLDIMQGLFTTFTRRDVQKNDKILSRQFVNESLLRLLKCKVSPYAPS